MRKILAVLFVIILSMGALVAQNKEKRSASLLVDNEAEQAEVKQKNEEGERGHVRLLYFNTLKDGDKGMYGISVDGTSSRVSMSFAWYGNYGLVDSDYAGMFFAMGPNANTKLSNACTFVCPLKLTVSHDSYYDNAAEKYKSRTGVGLMLDPYIALGSESFKICVGPQLNMSFKKGDKSTFALVVGLAF